MITSPPTLQQYLDLVPSEHNTAPRFMATLAIRLQPYVDLMTTLFGMIARFTPDATGNDLDFVGARIGANRNLVTPLTNVYFTWGTAGLGWGEGTWLGPQDNISGLTVLPDDAFQTVVALVIAMNNWDGTVPGAYAIWNSVMGSQYGLLYQDNQDETILIVFTGLIASVVTKALITGGFFNIVPAGVRITEFAQPSIANTPVFGWGVNNSTVGGWGTGCWIEPLI